MSPFQRAHPLITAAVIFTALWIPTAVWPLGRDQGVFAAVADVLRGGGALYRDAVDLKPPLIFLLYEAAISVSHSALAIRGLDLIVLGATLLCALLLYPPRRRAVLAPLLALIYGIGCFFLGDYWNAAVPDNYLALPVLGMLLLLRRGGDAWWAAVGAGLLCSFAFWLKFTAGVFLLLVPVMHLLTRRGWGRALKATGAAALGFNFGVALMLVYLWSAGSLAAFWEVGVVYPMRYAAFAPSVREDLMLGSFNVSQALRGFSLFAQWHPVLFIAPLLLAAITVLLRRFAHAEIWVALVLAVISVVAQRKFYMNHFGALVLWLSVLSALGLETLIRMAGARKHGRARWMWRTVAAAGAVLLLAVLTLGSTHFGTAMRVARGSTLRVLGRMPEPAHLELFTTGDSSALANARLAAHLRETTRPESRLFIWGFEPVVYFLAERRPASRFLFIAPLVAPGGEAWRDELLQTLRGDSPDTILVLRADNHWYLHGVHGDSRQLLESKFAALSQWILENYGFGEQIDDFTVMRRST